MHFENAFIRIVTHFFIYHKHIMNNVLAKAKKLPKYGSL